MHLNVKIEGMDRVLSKLSPDLLAKPVASFFTRAAITVQNEARTLAPVDTGRLRSSISYKVDTAKVPHWAKVGTNVFYAPYMEFSTGYQTDGSGGRKRHWPPPDALNTWAKRHGVEGGGFAVAKAIGRRGGLRPRRYLRGALEHSLDAIRDALTKLSQDIKVEWDKR